MFLWHLSLLTLIHTQSVFISKHCVGPRPGVGLGRGLANAHAPGARRGGEGRSGGAGPAVGQSGGPGRVRGGGLGGEGGAGRGWGGFRQLDGEGLEEGTIGRADGAGMGKPERGRRPGTLPHSGQRAQDREGSTRGRDRAQAKRQERDTCVTQGQGRGAPATETEEAWPGRGVPRRGRVSRRRGLEEWRRVRGQPPARGTGKKDAGGLHRPRVAV